ncbi:MAG: hypothetical protein AAGE92_14735 [Cyanobacteria bacterium P01_G01_bin.4]
MEELLKKVAPWLLLGAIALFILGLGIGWRSLANTYPGSNYRSQLSDVTWLNYAPLPQNGIQMTIGEIKRSSERVNLGSNGRGLFVGSLSVWTIFRPPLFIPWTDIEVDWSEVQIPIANIPIRSAKLRLRKLPNISITLAGAVAKDLLAHAPQPLSTSSLARSSSVEDTYGEQAQ